MINHIQWTIITSNLENYMHMRVFTVSLAGEMVIWFPT